MKKGMKNTLCASMILVMAGAALAGCSKGGTKGAVKKVEDNGKPFYDSELIYFEKPEIKDGDDSVETSGNIPSLIDGKYYQNLSYYIQDGNDYQEGNILVIYDDKGKIIEQRDLADSKAFKDLKDFGFSGSSGIHLDGQCLVNTYDPNSGIKSYIYDYIEDTLSEFNIGDLDDGYITGLCTLSDGTYAVQVNTYGESGSTCKVLFTDGKKVSKEVDLSDKFKKEEIDYFDEMTPNGAGFVISASSMTGSYYITYDESTGEFKLDDSDDDRYEYTRKAYVDGKCYKIDEKGIYIDGEKEPVIDFSCGNIAPNRVLEGELINIDDSGCTVIGNDYTYSSEKTYVLNITKYDKNPNVGKELLTLSTLSWFDTSLEDAVVKFNQESDKYYVQLLTDKYTLDYASIYEGVDMNSAESDEKLYSNYNSKQAELVNQLAIDLLAGDAPDIMMGCSQYSQLMKDSYLMDLKPFIDKDLDSKNFYTNIIEGTTYDGKIYTIPLTFHVEGIMADPSDVKGKTGFTYAEYVDFVKGPCNGNDPFTSYGMGKISVMQELFANESDSFIKDGKINVDSDEFRQIADFVKDNVTDPVSGDDEDYYMMGDYEEGPSYAYVTGFEQYISQATGYGERKDTYALYGVPSTDGRGPIVTFDIDISISAQSASSEGAKEFIKSIMSNDSLRGIAENSYGEAINKETTRDAAKDRIKDLNKNLSGNPIAKNKKFGEDDIDAYIKIIEGCRVRPACDPAILNIIAEEIPAYFAGQKDISEVIKSVNDRAQTVLDEKS